MMNEPKPFDQLTVEDYIRLIDLERFLRFRLTAAEQTLASLRRVLPPIVEQLRSCRYECEGGPLENNEAFIELVALSEG